MAIVSLSTPCKQQLIHIGKKVAPIVVFPMLAVSNAYADAPNVTEVVSDIGSLQAPIALVGGAYIGLKVFKRGWQIIKGFI